VTQPAAVAAALEQVRTHWEGPWAAAKPATARATRAAKNFMIGRNLGRIGRGLDVDVDAS